MYDPLDHTLSECASQYESVNVALPGVKGSKPDNYVIYVKYFLCVFQKMPLYTTAE